MLHYGLSGKVWLCNFDEDHQRESLQRRKKWELLTDGKGKGKGKGEVPHDIDPDSIDHTSIFVGLHEVQEEIRDELMDFLRDSRASIPVPLECAYELSERQTSARFQCCNPSCYHRACTQVASAVLKIKLHDVPTNRDSLCKWCDAAYQPWPRGGHDSESSMIKDFLLMLRKTMPWGRLLSYETRGEHLMSNCQACAFYGRSCRLKVDSCTSCSTMLYLSDVGHEATETSLREVLEESVLHESRVRRIILGPKRDIEKFLAKASGIGQEAEVMEDLDPLVEKIRFGEVAFHRTIREIEEKQIELRQLKEKPFEFCTQEESRCTRKKIHELSYTLGILKKDIPTRATVVEFDNAEVARIAICSLQEVMRAQNTFERSALSVGLMKKQWLNWQSIFFLRELMLRPRLHGHFRTAVRDTISKHCFGQIMQEGDMVRVVMISLLSWLDSAMKGITALSELLGTFEILGDPNPPIRQVISPKQLLDFGYVSDGSKHKYTVRLVSSSEPAQNSTFARTQVERASDTSSNTRFSGLPMPIPDHEEFGNTDFLKLVEKLCGISCMTDLKAYVIKLWGEQRVTQAPLTASQLTNEEDSQVVEQQSAQSLNCPSEPTDPACFVGDTLFKSASENYVPVQHLDVGVRVCSARGQLLEVVGRHLRQGAFVKLVEIRTDHATSVFTSTHRVLIGEGEQLAGDVRVGDLIGTFVSHTLDVTQEEVLEVDWWEQHTDVYEITFNPDLPVACFSQPTAQVLSMGQMSAHDADVGTSVQRRTRRGRKPPARPPSIPDTQWSF